MMKPKFNVGDQVSYILYSGSLSYCVFDAEIKMVIAPDEYKPGVGSSNRSYENYTYKLSTAEGYYFEEELFKTWQDAYKKAIVYLNEEIERLENIKKCYLYQLTKDSN